jgi:hypothetical protein
MREEFASYSFLALAVAGLVLLCSGLVAMVITWAGLASSLLFGRTPAKPVAADGGKPDAKAIDGRPVIAISWSCFAAFQPDEAIFPNWRKRPEAEIRYPQGSVEQRGAIMWQAIISLIYHRCCRNYLAAARIAAR